MALTNATTLADYSAGIGTQGAALTVDATNKRVGVGTDAPAGPEGSLQVGTGITFFGNTGIVSAIGGRFSGDFNVAGALTFEDVTNIDSLGFGTFRSGLTVQGAGSTTTTLSVTGVSTFAGNVSIADSIFHTADIDTSIRFPAADTFTVETGGSERLRVNSSGQLGIGANNNSDYDSNARNLLLASSGSTGITIRSGGSSDFALIHFADGTSGSAEQRAGRILYGHSDNFMSFHCANTERLRIDSSGHLIHTGLRAGGGDNKLAILSTLSHNTNEEKVAVYIAENEGSSNQLTFGGGSSSYNAATTLRFMTASAVDTTTGTERLRIDSSGRLLIGNTSSRSNVPGSDVGFQIEGASGGPTNKRFTQHIFGSGDGSGPYLGLAKHRGTSVGGNTIVVDGDELGGIYFQGADGTNFKQGAYILAEVDGTPGTNDMPGALRFATTADGASSPTERLRLNSSGYLGINNTNPRGIVHVGADLSSGATDAAAINLKQTGTNETTGIYLERSGERKGYAIYVGGGLDSLNFQRNNAGTKSDVMTMTRDGFVGINETSPGAQLTVKRANTSTSGLLGVLKLKQGSATNGNRASMVFSSLDDFDVAAVNGVIETHAGSESNNVGRLEFYTKASGSSITERMRILSGGAVLIGKTTDNSTVAGVEINQAGRTFITVANDPPLFINRTGGDGTLVSLNNDGSQEGTITVSGSTVSYNGGHLSRWSQLAGGAARTPILRGSVLSNLDEMCEWAYDAQDAVLYTEEDELPEGASVGDVKTPAVVAGTEDNEQLNRMKVSDVEGDKNVSGVFQDWDDDDDTYVNDFYCAMTGDFIIRIAQGTTVARGDLLMSAGDGTAKPQDDDIVRSKTIAKVTSTTVSTTYSDNSYCVPCVLMSC